MSSEFRCDLCGEVLRAPELQNTSMYSALRASPVLFKFDPIEFSRFAASRLHNAKQKSFLRILRPSRLINYFIFLKSSDAELMQ